MIINTKSLKNYIIFIVAIILFLVTTLYSGLIYINWDKDLEANNGDPTKVEVNLPIIDWTRYRNLSKQCNDASISETE